jgi:spermidine synthase
VTAGTSPAAILAAGLAGFACMAAELTAVRVLAPHFGDSAYVWTNVIGVILAALALGALLGGRLAGRGDGTMWARRLLLASGALLVLVPFVASPVGAWLLPRDLPLDAAMPALVRGSLTATILLFAPPLFLLAAVSPLLVVELARRGTPVGRAAGSISAAGTIGSLVGTFAATHWLVPTFGCRASLVVAAVALMLAAAVLGRQRGVAAMAGLLAIASLAGHGDVLRPAPPGRTLLAERETCHQLLQVHREATAEGPTRTLLVINEALDSFHSLDVEGSALSGAYYDWHAVAPLLAGAGERPAGLRVLSIGDAAGTLRTVYAAVHPGAQVDAVDIDGATMALGDEFFEGPKAQGARWVLDGRIALANTRSQWHVVHVDAYAHQVYIPAHLASREFFALAKERLLPGGILALNVGALRADDPVLRAVGTTVAAVFGSAHALPIPRSRNWLLVARRDQPLDPGSLASAPGLRTALPNDADEQSWHRLLTAAAAPAAWIAVGEGGAVLADDRPVLDQLLHASYVDRTDPAAPVRCAGELDLAAAELQAFEHRQRAAWEDVLGVVAKSREPSAYLREAAGDARWGLRQLRAAVAEYEAGLLLGPTADAAARLRQRLEGAREELAPIAAAEAVAARNSWLALACALGALAAAFAALRASQG